MKIPLLHLMRLGYQILYKDSVKIGVGSLYNLYTFTGKKGHQSE
ncbi:hypothetical protein RU98_GL000616 [Enterococcus caccae]|nr:hypothetical protein RU98_GL000616 [Enterococcus caccae]